MKLIKKISVQVSSDLKALDGVLSWFEGLNQPGIPKKIWLQCQLALAEGFTNAVRHAHKGKTSDVPIDIEVNLFSECLEIRIWDQGPPFDLEARLKKPEEISKNATGGRGIAILQKIADYLSYTRTDKRNCLLVVKHYSNLLASD
ncbi:MAG: ATP-binding protein [Cyanobacteriota bacterium]